MSLLKILENVLFPEVCIFCMKYSKNKICHYCRGKLVISSGSAVVSKNLYEYGYVYCYGRYSGMLKKRFSDYKFKGELWLGRCFGELMYNRFSVALTANLPDLITYVPVSNTRFKERGYDQSREIAEAIAEKMNIECLPLLVNTSGGLKQSRLDRKKRISEAKGRFSLNGNYCDVLKGRILIIDDILTTGATINECAGILTEKGAASVDAMIFASGRSDII